MSDFSASLKLAASGLNAQSSRMRIIAENLANSESAAKVAGEDPFRRRIPTFEAIFDREMGAYNVEVGKLSYDMSEFEQRFQPGHPAADESGYVMYPNVDPLIEMADMREAQRTYEANLNVVTSTRQMFGTTLDILRG